MAWLSPDSDLAAVERAAHLADLVAVAQRRYGATTEPRDGRVLVALSREYGAALAELGLSPVSRSRLGVGEVRPVIGKLAALSRPERTGVPSTTATPG